MTRDLNGRLTEKMTDGAQCLIVVYLLLDNIFINFSLLIVFTKHFPSIHKQNLFEQMCIKCTNVKITKV